MRPKMHGLLLDTSINSASTVRLNIYQVPLGSCRFCFSDMMIWFAW
jgi:hypothetical protein